MPIKKISDLPGGCTHRDHHPDTSGLSNGIYEHTCEGCKQTRKLVINRIIVPKDAVDWHSFDTFMDSLSKMQNRLSRFLERDV